MGKKRSRARRQERHTARVDRLRHRQSERRHRGEVWARYEAAVAAYRQAIEQGWACELVEKSGYRFLPRNHTTFWVTGDPYYEVVICDRCGLAQNYECADPDDPHDVRPCEGFDGVGCGSLTCITVPHHIELTTAGGISSD